jgi:dipeptidyl aminopeptidase/acylaminoacyl peptidase
MLMRTLRIVVAAGLAMSVGMLASGQVAVGAARDAAVTSAWDGGSPSIAQFLKIRVPGAAIEVDAKTMYVTDWPDGVTQLYKVVGAGDGPLVADKSATYVKITEFPDGISGATVSPDGKTMLATAARGGNERTQVYLVKPAAGAGEKSEVTPLITNEKANIAPAFWFKDSTGFVYVANDTSPNDFYIYRYDLGADGKGKSTLLLGKPGNWEARDGTSDKSRYLVSEFRSASDQDLFELDAATGTLTKLNPSEEAHSNQPIGYMPGEKAVLYTSDIEEGRARLFLRDLATGKVSKPIPALDSAEVDEAVVSPDRTLLAVVLNNEGYGELKLFTLPEFQPAPLPQMEKGLVSGVRFRERTLYYALTNSRQPTLAYAYQVPQNVNNKMMPVARQLTGVLDDQGIDLSKFQLPELIKFKSFDGLEVPAFLYLPPGAKKGEPVPFVVNFHGGPEGQHRPGFDRSSQFLLSKGYGVLMPNVRGSTGYGRAYQMMDDYKKRWDSVRDGVESARWLVKQGYAKAGHIAVYGGSYGGFMSVATSVEDGSSKEPILGAAINVVGIVNMKTFLEQTSGYRRKLREAEYGPLSDPEFLASVSSINRVNDIKVPMMIAHGLNDPRVPVGEAMQLAIALKKRGMDPVEFYAPDEGHGFAKLENRLLFQERMVKFLDSTIGKK